ncbi:MAG: PAS domain S-box protein, partial [Hymenobacter sp.]
MLSEASYEVLQQTLCARDAEIIILRSQLAAAQVAATSPHLGDLPNFVSQMQGLFVGVITTDARGNLTWANSPFRARYGQPLPKLLGRPVVNLLGDTQLDEATQALVAGSLAGGSAFQFDLPEPCADHAGGWLRVRMQPLRRPAPAELLFVGMLEDISEEKQAQLALAKSERRYRELAEQIPGGLYRWRNNLDGTFTSLYTSPKMYELFGIELDNPASLNKLIHPDDRARYFESIAAATAEGSTTPWHFEGRLVVPGRPLIWWRGNAALSYRDAQGAVYSGIIEDITLLKKTEEVERQRQLRQQLAIEGLGDGTWEHDCKQRCTYFSPELLAWLGYSPQMSPAVGHELAAYAHPDDIPQIMRCWENYAAGNVPIFSSEHRLRCFDGSYLWVLNRGLITKRDAQGQPLLITGLSIDISANKKAEEELLTAALRLSATIDSLQRGILLVDKEQRIVQTNAAFCRIFKLNTLPEQLIGLTDYQAAELAKHNFADSEAFMRSTAETIGRQESVFDEVVSLSDGRIMQRSFIPVWQNGNSIGHLWKFDDITARYQAEQTLKRQEEKYRNIIDNMQLGLVEMDLNHHVLYANQSYCQMVGYSEAELLGQQLHPLIMRPQVQHNLHEQLTARRRGIAGSYELEITTKQGERKWVFVGAAPTYDEDKQPAGTIGINLDITHQKHLEQNLREAKQQAENSARAKELFLANMSHEIRTPMNAILGMSQLLAKTTLAPRQSNYLHAIS